MNFTQSSTSSLFGSSTGGNALFGSGGGGGGTPMFGGKSTPNKNVLGGLGGGLGQVKGTIGVKYQPPKGKDGMYQMSITAQNETKGKSLDELRIEDYISIKSGQVPDAVQNKIRQNMQGQGSGGGSLSGGLLGGGGSGGSLLGNTSGGGGGLFGASGSSGGGGLPNLPLQRGNVIPGSGNTGGLGGLGGNTAGGGLFGNKTGTGTGGGILGGGTGGLGTQGGGGGLFGNKTGGTGGGLLGGQQQGGGGGLFGNQQQGGQTGGGLLGGGSGGGLLGGQSNQQGGGLFGNKTGGTGGGLLGGQQQGGGGGGLFGNQQQGGGGLLAQNKTSGGLLGGGGGGGLFSGSSGGTSGGGGLFGNKQGGTGLLGGGSGQSGGLFGNQGGTGQGGGLFGGQQGGQQANPHLFANVDALRLLLENMDPSWKVKLMESKGETVPQQLRESITPTEKKEPTGTYVPYKPQETKSDTKDQGYGRKKTLNEMAMSLSNRNWSERKETAQNGTFTSYVPFDIRNGKKLEETQKKAVEIFGLNRRFGPHSVIKKVNNDDIYDNNSSYLEDRIEVQLRPKHFMSRSSIIDELNESQSSISSLKKGRNIYNSSIVINLEIYIKGKREERPLKLRIFNRASVHDLKLKALEILFELGRLQGVINRVEELEALCIRTDLFKDGFSVNPQFTLDHAKINEEDNRAILSIETHRETPKLTKRGYYTNPPMSDIELMNDQQLRYVENFAIWNEYGRIEFEGESDIRGLDLDELVFIDQGQVEVYPESKFPTEESKPKRGEKLNKPAIITLYRCFRKKGGSSKQKRQSGADDSHNDVEVLGYNENTGEYQMRVLHFTKYGFDPTDSDEEEGEEEQKIIQKEIEEQRAPNFGAFIAHIPKPDMRASGRQGGFASLDQEQLQRPSQRRGIGFLETDKEDIFGESQGSESGKLRELIGEPQLSKADGLLGEDEFLGQSDEELETYSQQFRRRHGVPGQKILKGAQGRIYMHPEPPEIETETEGLEPESAKYEERDEMLEEKIDEDTGYTQSKLTELVNLAETFTGIGRIRSELTGFVREMSVQVKPRCKDAINKLGILNKRIVGKSTELINPNQREFYMNRSFRVGWTKNGFASVNRSGEVSVHKVIIHRDLGLENLEDNNSFNYGKYKKNLSFISKNLYEPLMKSLVNNSANMDELAQLSLSESLRDKKRASFLKFPDAAGLSSALIEYVESIGNRPLFREETDETKKIIFGELRLKDVEILSLMNTLFGQCQLDLWEYAINYERGQISEEDKEEIKVKLERSVEREKQNVFIRKHGLSKWLERKSGQFVERAISYHKEQNGYDMSVTDEILTYLSGKQVKRATEACNQHGLGRLAVLISTLSANSHMKERVHQQLKEWINAHHLENVSQKRIYEFLSGDTSVIDLYDWTRLFGTELWYLAKPTLTFPDMFNNFYQEKIQNPRKYEPVQSIFNNSLIPEQKHFELGFILIGLFAKHKEFSRTKLLNPYTHSSDCLDVKFLWLIEEYLSNNQELGSKRSGISSMLIESSQSLSKEEVEFKYRLLRGFCYQLELIGLWDYAVYAVLVANSEVISEQDKLRYVRHILQRHYKETEIFLGDIKLKVIYNRYLEIEYTKGIKKKGLKKELLVEQLGVKQSVLFESKAFKHLYSFRYTKTVKNLIKCGAWRNAYYVLCRQLVPLAICNTIASDPDNEKSKTTLRFVQKVLETLSSNRQNLIHWDREGRVIQQYLKEILSQEIGLSSKEGLSSLNDLITLGHKVPELEKYQEEEAFSQMMVDKVRRDLALIMVKRMPQQIFFKQHDKVLDCLENLNKRLKEDRTELALKYIEKEANY